MNDKEKIKEALKAIDYFETHMLNYHVRYLRKIDPGNVKTGIDEIKKILES